MRRQKLLATTAAFIGLTSQVLAGFFDGSTDFEGDNPLADALWGNVGNAEIMADASVASVPRAANLPPSFDEAIRTNVLDIDTGDTIVRYLQSNQEAPAASTIYADALVKGCPLAAGASAPEAGDDDKILVYTRINQSGDATNLCVYAKDGANGTAQEFVLTQTVGADEWHRLVIKATSAGYQVYCDGVDAANLCKTSGDVDTFYALNAGAPMTSVAFTGTGCVDDLVLSDLDPTQIAYSFTWDTALASISYTIDGITTNALTVADGAFSFQAPANTTVTIFGDTGYLTFTDTYATDSTAPTHAVASPTGLAFYSTGDGSAANPYEIPCYGALVAMKDAVAADASYRGAYYIQTADIDAAGEEPFAGIGTYAAKLTEGVAFTGTYDGQGHKISNIDFTQRNYGGVFNQVKGGTIRNLVVENITCGAFDASVNGGEWGCAIIGNAGMGATLQNLEARGDFGTAAIPCSHNVAGIAIRVCGGASNVVDGVVMLETLVKDCTNNAALHGTYTKLGGMSALTQDQNGVPNDYVLYDGCVNNGDITATANANGKNPGVDGIAGMVGYVGEATQLKDCVNTGTFSSVYASAKIAELVANHTSKELTDLGGNKGDAAKKFVHTQGSANLIAGFKYATVENGVATTIPPPYTLSAGNTYLLEGNVAASAMPVATLAANETIAFDTALGYTFAGTVDAAAPLVVIPSTEGTVKTFTAAITDATWIGGAQGDWETASNWNVGYVPTRDTVVTFTNDAQVAISNTDACKELVLSNANVTLVRHANATQPILRFYNNEERAVSVASGATGSLAVNGIALFNERTDSASLIIGCGFEILGDLTFRGVNPGNDVAASFTITNKTTISASALVKTIDHGTTKFLGGIEVAKGVTAKITTKPHGTAQIGTGVTLVANDGEGAATAIWLMQKEGTSRGVSLVNNASIAVDADHAGLCYVKQRSEREDYIPCDIYEVCWKRTVTVTTNGVTVAGVETGEKVIPGTNLVISVSGVAEGYEPSVTITKTADSSVLLTTNAVSFAYTMPDFDIDVTATAVKAAQSFNDPEGLEITDQGLIDWLSNNGFSQDDIDALGHDAAATDKLYECWLLNCSITAQNPGGALSITAIAVSNKVAISVQLVRQDPLGFINGVIHIYGADDLTAGFSRSPISEESVGFGADDDPIFDTTETEGAVTQSVTAFFNTADVTAKFFKAVIEFPIVDNPEEPEEPEEPEPDPEE